MNEIQIWEDGNINEIKEAFGKNLTVPEFKLFINLGKALNANPFTREIFAVKYGNGPANIFCGRDFYRRKAQEQIDYDGLQSSAVYENDDFEVENGIPKHKFGLKNRGKLIGSYAVVYRKNIRQPYFVFVDFKEYYQGNKKPDGTVKQREYNGKWQDSKPTVWDEKGATMICKVAEAQCLRGAYQGVFKGTYDESEQWKTIEKEAEHVEILKEIPKNLPKVGETGIENGLKYTVNADGRKVYESGESNFEEVEQPELEPKKTKEKKAPAPAKILELLEAEIYTSTMDEDPAKCIDELKTRWEKKRENLTKQGVYEIGLQKIKNASKGLEG